MYSNGKICQNTIAVIYDLWNSFAITHAGIHSSSQSGLALTFGVSK